jgi:aquaporin Z
MKKGIAEFIGTFTLVFFGCGAAELSHASRRLCGSGLTLTAIHIVGIDVTGVPVNPARSIGPALIGIFHNPKAFGQLWLFIIAPMLGAGVAGLLFKPGAVLSVDQP